MKNPFDNDFTRWQAKRDKKTLYEILVTSQGYVFLWYIIRIINVTYMSIYTISNSKNDTVYNKEFMSETEARHWVINTLDLSLNWDIRYNYEMNTPF